MNYEEFKQEVADRIKEFLPEKYADADVSIQTVVKNNDQKLDGLMVKLEDSNIAPNIYLNQFYEQHEDGRPMDDILAAIADVRTQHEMSQDFDVSKLTDFDSVKDRITCRLINAEQNAEYLADKPHTMVDDLAVTYHIAIGKEESGTMSAPITNRLMEGYGVDVEQLHQIALDNMDTLTPATFKSMTETMVDMMLPDMMRSGMSEEEAREAIAGMIPPTPDEMMYVLSNEDKLNGAAVLLNDKVMDDITEKLGQDYFILPSSVHEVLIVPKNDQMDLKTLESMVQDVNATQVAPEERLSDHVYAYDAKLDINTISQEQHGSLSEYLTGVEAYLTEKQAQIIQEAQQHNTEITYTVAECGEFHSMGAYYEGIATIEEAKALFEGIRESHSNTIPAVGINIHEAGTPEIDDVQMDVLYGNSIDLDDLRYVPQIWHDQEGLSKIGQIIDAFPDAKVVGELPGLTVQDRAQPDMDAVKPVYVDEAAKLAAEIDRFSSDFDPYEYKDTVDNWELQVQNIADDIRNGNSADYKKYLGTVIEESDNIEDVRKAAELLVKLAEYKPLAKVEELEEVNLNQIDNVLSNTVPKSEERRKNRQAEQERLEELQRIEEEERKRRARGERPSLRARLAAKKAIVAANSAVPQRETQRQVQNEPVKPQIEL